MSTEAEGPKIAAQSAKPRVCKALRFEQVAMANGRYWARTSDPQLVELVLSQLS
jgi:hypothetical protein